MSATTLRTRGGESPALARFHPLVREWFTRAFPAPTPAQERGWPPIADGEHSLILAPTGSGKTLAAFLWGLNGIVEDRLAGRQPSRLLYLSPLKALNYDVERNLRGPLAGIAAAAALQGLEAPEVSVAVRTGDTPQRDRQRMLRTPPDILITTPESLYLLLTSRGEEILAGIRAVIVDEIHAVAGTKRGTHLALSLERLDRWWPGRGRPPAHRPLGHPAAAGRDRALPGRPGRRGPPAPGVDRRRREREGARPERRRAGGGHARAGPAAGRGGRSHRGAGRRGPPALHLAGDVPASCWS